jgi:hypothetical protein
MLSEASSDGRSVLCREKSAAGSRTNCCSLASSEAKAMRGRGMGCVRGLWGPSEGGVGPDVSVGEAVTREK